MKNKNNKWPGFFTNLLGVILGITLTFGVNDLWQKREDKKKTREILILVRDELETNKQWFKTQVKMLKRQSSAYAKLLEADKKWDTIPRDSLIHYRNQILQTSFSQLSSSAWQLFQNSEMIQKISNKELVLTLSECYFFINFTYDFIMSNFWNKRTEAIAMLMYENELYPMLDALVSNREAFYFLNALNQDDSFWNTLTDIEAFIDFAILLLDKYGDFKIDMSGISKEFAAFVEERTDSTSKNDTIVNNIN